VTWTVYGLRNLCYLPFWIIEQTGKSRTGSKTQSLLVKAPVGSVLKVSGNCECDMTRTERSSGPSKYN
jgi:hypothetical protein